MGSKQVNLRKISDCSLNELLELIIADASKQQSYLEIVLSKVEHVGNIDVALLIMTKLYFRNKSYASVTVQITDDGEWQRATVVGSGGGEGIFNISWGTNSSIADMAVKLLRKRKFSLYNK